MRKVRVSLLLLLLAALSIATTEAGKTGQEAGLTLGQVRIRRVLVTGRLANWKTKTHSSQFNVRKQRAHTKH